MIKMKRADQIKAPGLRDRYKNVIEKHFESISRLDKNMRYYENKAEILNRQRLSDIPNNKVAYPFASYISNLSAAYLMGEPVSYSKEEEDKVLDEIITLYSDEGISEQDMNAALYQSIFGRAVMLVYINAEGRPITKAIDPRFCFAVCDESVEENLLFFVYMTANNKNSDFLVYTDDSIYSFEGKKVSKIINVFGKIPVIEIKNNINDVGDFEPIITLIDAYNKIGSDRVNDREQFSDSLLVLRGVSGLGEDEESEVEEVSRMREQKILALPDSDATAEWLTKPNEGKDVELLRDSLEQDIHKLSQTPNFSDGSFGGNNSGVAIRYKLFGFDNRTRLKEAYMRRGLHKRLELYAIWLNGGRDLIDGIDDVIIHFSRRLPVDEADRAKALKDLDGLITPEAIKDNSPFQEDNNR